MGLGTYARSVSVMVVLVSLGSIRLCAQQKEFSRDQLVAAAREIMRTSRYCALITSAAHGRTNARTMDAFAPDEKMIVWLATNPRSHKVAEIRRNPRVTLYYFDRENQAYVTIHGTARLVNDQDE